MLPSKDSESHLLLQIVTKDHGFMGKLMEVRTVSQKSVSWGFTQRHGQDCSLWMSLTPDSGSALVQVMRDNMTAMKKPVRDKDKKKKKRDE